VNKNFGVALVLFSTVTVLLTAQNRRSIHPDDANGDGVISRQEWKGNLSDFQRLDTNRDGVLSGTEIPQVGGNDRDMRQNRTGGSQGNAEVRKLDKNGSGVVEGYEWPYNPDVFHRLDTDENSVLSADELRNLSSVAQKEQDQIENRRSDTNRGRSTYPEFDRLDKNRDGKVTPDEYMEQGAEWQRRQRFDEWDSNRNGIIDSTEWKAAPQLFQRLDTNRDGRVTWEEFRADTQRYRPPYNWR